MSDLEILSERPNKGNSIIAFPDDYAVIDIETTGLSPDYDQIIEVSAIKFSNGNQEDSFSSLINPGRPIDSFITELTGITNEMLATAPQPEEVLSSFYDFVSDSILLGWAVSFDINFLYDNCEYYLSKAFTNDFIDAMRIARKEQPNFPHHRLKDIAEYYGIHPDRAHRAFDDCITCNECYLALKQEIVSRGEDLDSYYLKFKKHRHKLKASDIVATQDTIDPDHPLFGKVCVFTGVLEKMTRTEAMQLVANIGAIPGDGVTKKTNYLILGNNDYCSTIKGGKSTKQKKAEELIIKGCDLQILPENVFYELVLGE